MKIKRAVALGLVTTQVFTLAGCSRKNEIAELPLTTATTKQEVLDYYAKSYKYDAVITRAADEHKHETTYEEHVITDEETLEEIKDAYKKAEGVLGNNIYPAGTDSSVISEDVFNYVKACLNELELSGGQIVEDGITGALGYYFVDVKYNTSAASAGTFNTTASLLGLNSGFTEDYITGEIYKNDNFIQAVIDSGNKYFIENKINKSLTYNDTDLFQIIDGASVDYANIYGDTSSDDASTDVEQEDTSETGSAEDEAVEPTRVEDTAEQEEETTEQDEAEAEEQDETTEDENSLPLGNVSTANETTDRTVKFDIEYINSIVGSTAEYGTIMPELSLIYNIPSNSGTMSGVCIYPCGINGMKLFGYNREQTTGDITLRYVFKESDDGSGNISNVNIYVKEMNNNIAQFSSDSNVIIPSYLEEEFEILLERADRAIVDCNLSAMISDNIFTDLGYGVLRGYYSKSTDTLRCMSVIRQVVSRDIDNNAYILEIETTVQDGAKSANTQGTYRDKSYIVVQQYGQDFKISDWVRISRTVTKEPDIDTGNSAMKRLVALNLTGEVRDDTKESATKLLDDFYTASTNRYLYGPYDIEDSDGNVTTYERGMYDCFNNDTELLSSAKKEEINSRTRSYLTAFGIDKPCEYIGTVDEWIGGSKNQVEFTTEEVMSYGNGQVGRYFRTYYLMSNINDTWYIDEMTILDTEELDADEIESTYNRIKGK